MQPRDFLEAVSKQRSKEWRMLKAVPWTFGLSLLGLAGGIFFAVWYAFDWGYGRRIENYQTTISSQKDEIEKYKVENDKLTKQLADTRAIHEELATPLKKEVSILCNQLDEMTEKLGNSDHSPIFWQDFWNNDGYRSRLYSRAHKARTRFTRIADGLTSPVLGNSGCSASTDTS